MPANLLQKQVGRRQDGRFAKGRSGNPAGRTVGSRNRATLIAGAADIPAAMSAGAAGVAEGTLSPGEAFALSQVIDTFIRAIEAGEFERRLQLLENADGGLA